ncbi:MAG: inosine/xanthosine triphosphatase [Anaerolineales bacterium]
MPQIVIASKNPVKIQAALGGFERMFPNETWHTSAVTVPSGVSDQPMSDRETLQGAQQRAHAARAAHPQGDFWVGIEGGIEVNAEGDMLASAWVVVCSTNREGRGRTGTFVLPPAVAALVAQGKELGDADDKIFGYTNSKQQNGAVGILTGDVITRATFYEPAVILALIPFKNPNLYTK